MPRHLRFDGQPAIVASAEGVLRDMQAACKHEAGRFWKLDDGTNVAKSGKSSGSGMYEVKMAAGDYRGVCTVDEDGDVKTIMED